MSRLDPLWHALSKLRRGKYDECIAICDEMLANNPQDQVSEWFPYKQSRPDYNTFILFN